MDPSNRAIVRDLFVAAVLTLAGLSSRFDEASLVGFPVAGLAVLAAPPLLYVYEHGSLAERVGWKGHFYVTVAFAAVVGVFAVLAILSSAVVTGTYLRALGWFGVGIGLYRLLFGFVLALPDARLRRERREPDW